MYNPFNSGMRVLTPQDLGLNLNQESNIATLDDVDDDIDFNIGESNQKGYAIERELSRNNFNIRTLTQDQIDKMKNSANWSVKI